MTFPGYQHLIGPESLLMNRGGLSPRPVKDIADYRTLHEQHIRSSNAQVWTSPEKCIARVNHGRWAADCVWCRQAMLTRPDWGVAFCWTCGAQYEQGMVIFPDDPRIEKLLLLRPDPTTQHWDNKQTAEDLLRENREELHLADTNI
jgi:hypothetical protein